MAKKVCELCGYADDSYSIEENGTVMKVCKFCHDGYLERMGLSPDDDKPIPSEELAMQLLDDEAAEEISKAIDEISSSESGGAKVEPLTEEELKKVLTGGHTRKRTTKTYSQTSERTAVKSEETKAEEKTEEEEPSEYAEEKRVVTSELPAIKSEKPVPVEVKTYSRSVRPQKRRRDIMEEVNPRIDDERISITSPEIPLSKDSRPKTNLDVEVAEYKNSVRFMDAFKFVFHQIVYAIFLGVVVATVSTVLFIVDTWQHALIVLGGGIGAIGMSYFLMWYLRTRYDKDKRAYLLRIRQQEILFDSMNSDCYRELKTKFSVLKSLGWLLNKLSVLLPLVTIIGGVVASVITCFVVEYWYMPVLLAGSIVAGIVMYWLVKFFADIVTYKLDAERNQQIQQQTLLDILKTLKK